MKSARIFQLNGRGYPYEFDYDLLKYGTAVYVDFNESSEPTAFYLENRLGTTTYYLLEVDETQMLFTLKNRNVLDDYSTEKVLQATESYIDRTLMLKALKIVEDDVPPNLMFKTKKLSKSRLAAIITVKDRLELIAKLSESEKFTLDKDNETFMPRRLCSVGWHYTPLVVYLFLTCFDRLGQTPDWVTFGDWLNDKDKEIERKDVNLEGLEPLKIAKAYIDTYNKKYGASNAFRRFINEIIPTGTRQELLDSIIIKISNNYPAQPNTSDGDDKKKIDYLYSLRNDYTHKAHFRPGNPHQFPQFTEPRFLEKTVSSERTINYSCKNWPEVFEKVVKDGLRSYVEKIVSEHKKTESLLP